MTQNAGGAGNLGPDQPQQRLGATFLSIDAYPDYATLYTSHNLRYTNHSYGAGTIPSGGYDSLARDHDLRIAAYPNHLVVYSAGNSGEQTGYAPYAFPTWATITGAMKMNKNMFAIGAQPGRWPHRLQQPRPDAGRSHHPAIGDRRRRRHIVRRPR
ncbi:MAG: hypothetical protein HZY76_23405 [Anaerolineae bacterium]|nr:MAG: hypothetical protein HZY76_23405 [Anaerolineae bacterium]